MTGNQLTTRENEIIKQLFAQRDINTYEIVEVINEGRELPGSLYDWEVELLLGVAVTPTDIYMFVLDWIDGKYTLGDKNGMWRELTPDDLGDEKEHILTIQHQLNTSHRREDEANLDTQAKLPVEN